VSGLEPLACRLQDGRSCQLSYTGVLTSLVMTTPDMRNHAPWTVDEVASLNGYQHSSAGHPFTCGNDCCRGGHQNLASKYAPLRADTDGWHCDFCGYTQDWAYTFMTDWSWTTPAPWSLIVWGGVHDGHLSPGSGLEP
jgi:hypothetical protein